MENHPTKAEHEAAIDMLLKLVLIVHNNNIADKSDRGPDGVHTGSLSGEEETREKTRT